MMAEIVEASRIEPSVVKNKALLIQTTKKVKPISAAVAVTLLVFGSKSRSPAK